MAKQPKAPRMLTHGQIWTALDRLAERAGLSTSGLAKRSGLDPTTFNKSKRIAADGRERWPSTESVAKALAATNSSIDSFVQLIGDRVVVKTRAGEVMVKEMKRRTAKTLELQSLSPNQADRILAAGDVEWIARIVWASQ